MGRGKMLNKEMNKRLNRINYRKQKLKDNMKKVTRFKYFESFLNENMKCGKKNKNY